jgi:hypothetical protein
MFSNALKQFTVTQNLLKPMKQVYQTVQIGKSLENRNVLMGRSKFRGLAAGLSWRRLGFDPGSVHVGFVVNNVALGQVSPPVVRFSPRPFHSIGVPLLGKTKKKQTIFLAGLHNKSQGCGASVASAAGPFTTKKSLNQFH